MIADQPEVYLNTGHVSNEEAMRLIDLAVGHGIRRILVASSVTKNMSVEEQRAAAKKGALIEHTLAAFTHTTPVPKTHYYVEREYASIDEGMEDSAHSRRPRALSRFRRSARSTASLPVISASTRCRHRWKGSESSSPACSISVLARMTFGRWSPPTRRGC